MRAVVTFLAVLALVEAAAGAPPNKRKDNSPGRDEIVVKDVALQTLEAARIKLRSCVEQRQRSIRQLQIEFFTNRRARAGLHRPYDEISDYEIKKFFRKPSKKAYGLIRPATYAERVSDYKTRHGAQPGKATRRRLKREAARDLRAFTSGRLRRVNAFKHDLDLYEETTSKIGELKARPLFSFASDPDLPMLGRGNQDNAARPVIGQLSDVKVIEILSSRKMICNFAEDAAKKNFLIIGVDTSRLDEGQEFNFKKRLFHTVEATHTFPSGNSKRFLAYLYLPIRDQYDLLIESTQHVTSAREFEDWIIRHTTTGADLLKKP